MVLELKSWPLYERLAKGLNYRDSADYPGIQMADLLGYLLNRFVGMGQAGMGEEQAWALSRVCGIRVQYEFFGARKLEETLDANLTPEHRAWLKSQV